MCCGTKGPVGGLVLNSKKQLVVSALGGVLVFFLIYTYLDGIERKINSRQKMSSVLRVKSFIRQGRVVSEDLVETVLIPEAYIEPKAVRANGDLKDSSGRLVYKAAVGLLKGEQLTKTRIFKDRAFQNLAWSLPPGQMALTLKLNLEQAVGGHLDPGDWISVFCTKESSSYLLLEGVQVLAIQERVWDPAREMEEKNFSKILEKDSLMITLALSSRQAAKLLLGMERGKIWLSLNSPLGSEKNTRLVVNSGDLERN